MEEREKGGGVQRVKGVQRVEECKGSRSAESGEGQRVEKCRWLMSADGGGVESVDECRGWRSVKVEECRGLRSDEG